MNAPARTPWPALRHTVKWLLLAVLTAGGCATTLAPAPRSKQITVSFTPAVVDPKHPHRDRFGPLTLTGSFQLRADDPRFGGISGIALAPDGKTLWGISDRGNWFRGRLQLSRSGALIGLQGVTMGALIDLQGRPLRGKQTDAESLILGHGEELFISFEQEHRLWHYSKGPGTAPSPLPLPAALKRAPRNGGLEAIAHLPDGRWLLLCEELEGPEGSRQGWVLDGAAQNPLSYPVSGGFVPTDMATLSSGAVLILERHFSVLSGLKIRIRLIHARELKPGATLQPRELVRLERPLEVDNFEGLTLFEEPLTGAVTLYLISDDNFSAFQRTLLYQFRVAASALQ